MMGNLVSTNYLGLQIFVYFCIPNFKLIMKQRESPSLLREMRLGASPVRAVEDVYSRRSTCQKSRRSTCLRANKIGKKTANEVQSGNRECHYLYLSHVLFCTFTPINGYHVSIRFSLISTICHDSFLNFDNFQRFFGICNKF